MCLWGEILRKLMGNDKGSYTIEVSMVFTIVIMAVLALMFTFAYMLQKVSLVRLATYAAQQGAYIWTDSRRNPENGIVDISEEKDSLYYRLNDNLLFSEKTFEWSTAGMEEKDDGGSLLMKKAGKIKSSVCENLKGFILKPRDTSIRIGYSNNLLKGQLTVEVTQEISIPLGGIKAFFDGKDTVTLQGRAASTVVEPAEYIRNIDLAVELSKKIEDEISFEDILERISNKKQKK